MRLSSAIERAAQINPRGGGTAFAGRRHDWQTFVERVKRIAGGLTAAGLAPNDRVAMISLNSDRFCELVFAISWAGGVVQPVNMRLAAAEMAEQIVDSGARLIITDEAGASAIAPTRSGLGNATRWIDIGDRAADGISYDALFSSTPMERPAPGASDDFAVLFYTGGTTGRAKGVMLSHRNLTGCALSQSAALPMAADDVSLHALPMFHVGAISGMLVGIMGGGGHRFLARFDPVDFMATVASERVTRTSLGPTMIKMLLEHPRFAEFDLSSVRRLHYGSAPIAESLLEETIRKLPGIGLIQGYGQTEASGVISMLVQRYHVLDGPNAGKLRSAGQAVPGVEVRIVDNDGVSAEAGQVGEICARGDPVMLGYWNRPEETAAALQDGWLHTGDMGYLDDDGFLFVADRLKDMIVTGGENVFSAEVEGALLRHPDVEECAVIGVPSDKWGEQVHAIVRPSAGSTIDEPTLVAHCATLIARFKCPKSIEFRTAPLPLSAVGKVLKADLRRENRPVAIPKEV